jgi:peptidoglycan-associated lipoprotein
MTGNYAGIKVSTGFRVVFLSMLAAMGGCKDPVVTKASDDGRVITAPPTSIEPRFDSGMTDRIFFKYDSSAITPEARSVLERMAVWAKANPQANLTVEGHCDDRGTREYNLALGERRAEAARAAELALGVAAGRLQAVSYGKERPEATGETEAAWAQNRRAVFVVQ